MQIVHDDVRLRQTRPSMQRVVPLQRPGDGVDVRPMRHVQNLAVFFDAVRNKRQPIPMLQVRGMRNAGRGAIARPWCGRMSKGSTMYSIARRDVSQTRGPGSRSGHQAGFDETSQIVEGHLSRSPRQTGQARFAKMDRAGLMRGVHGRRADDHLLALRTPRDVRKLLT